ncbi:hypothetical protein SDC9_155140 [bioreactor metagenome]|uniref:Uncharacterized protein n=1 Tax=bioreactor metagenome TaxID=1076179 RepID=A0A645F0M3_9ZZZZ
MAGRLQHKQSGVRADVSSALLDQIGQTIGIGRLVGQHPLAQSFSLVVLKLAVSLGLPCGGCKLENETRTQDFSRYDGPVPLTRRQGQLCPVALVWLVHPDVDTLFYERVAERVRGGDVLACVRQKDISH